MSRAFDVMMGISMIASLWLWMFSSIDIAAFTWSAAFLVFSKIIVACFITAPVYRQYLK